LVESDFWHRRPEPKQYAGPNFLDRGLKKVFADAEKVPSLEARIATLEAELSHIRNWAGMVCDDDVTREQNLLGIAKIADRALKRT
jgi:hypothetical protein